MCRVPFINSVTFLSVVVNMMFHFDNSLWHVTERCVTPKTGWILLDFKICMKDNHLILKESFQILIFISSCYFHGNTDRKTHLKFITSKKYSKVTRTILLSLYFRCNIVKKIRRKHLKTFYRFNNTTFSQLSVPVFSINLLTIFCCIPIHNKI